jgi:hypothetical protein
MHRGIGRIFLFWEAVVFLEDSCENVFFTPCKLRRKLSYYDHASHHVAKTRVSLMYLFFLITVGARVYARWPRNRAYYRGFVGQTHSSTIFISYDDGDEITHPKNDASAVILDKIPQLQDLKTAQKVIASWRDSNIRYYPGHFSGSCPSGVSGYKYLVKFDDADKHDFCDFIYQIRTVPEICA